MYLRNDSARSASADEIGERDLRLHHPELGQVPAGVAVLGAERRPERVDLRQRQAVGLDVQLAADGQKRFLAEEVLGEVGAPVGRARDRREVGEVERADAEHLAGAFGVAGGDDRRVHPEEPVLVEVAMDRHAEAVPDARHGAERVGPRPQVRDLAQVLERGLLRLDRIRLRVVDPADDLDASACSSTACPCPWLCASVPVAMTEQPDVSFLTSLS